MKVLVNGVIFPIYIFTRNFRHREIRRLCDLRACTNRFSIQRDSKLPFSTPAKRGIVFQYDLNFIPFRDISQNIMPPELERTIFIQVPVFHVILSNRFSIDRRIIKIGPHTKEPVPQRSIIVPAHNFINGFLPGNRQENIHTGDIHRDIVQRDADAVVGYRLPNGGIIGFQLFLCLDKVGARRLYRVRNLRLARSLLKEPDLSAQHRDQLRTDRTHRHRTAAEDCCRNQADAQCTIDGRAQLSFLTVFLHNHIPSVIFRFKTLF